MNKGVKIESVGYNYVIVALIIALCAVVFSKLFTAGFLSWDDAEYVLENKDAHDFNVKALVSKFYVGNYHPITMLNYAIDWKLFGKQALGYHIENLIWHLINTYLVYLLAIKILKHKLSGLFVALIFCFHPVQLETIAWIAERKNLLYAFFLLLASLSYFNFLETKLNKWWIFTLLFFIFSCLSKPSAIIFPLLLFVFDYAFYQKIYIKNWVSKIPFFIISIIIGIVTLKAQSQGKFLNDSHEFLFYQQVLYAGYAFLQYVSKFIFPINLSVIYPYPQNTAVALFLGAITLIAFAVFKWKVYKAKQFIILLGFLFFVVNVLLVLQFIPFGEALTADRYMYIPIIGLAIIVAFVFSKFQKYFKYIVLVIVILLSLLTYSRSRVWENSIKLYLNVLDKYPNLYVALNSVGAEYMLTKNYDLSLRYLNKAINENRNYYKGYYNRGLLYVQTERYKDALADFNKCISLKQYPKAIVARANVYYILKDFPKAIQDAETTLKLEPLNHKAHYVLANCYDDLNQLDKALVFYNKAISANTDVAVYYLRRAIVSGKMQQFQNCLSDLTIAINLKPDFAEAYYWKGVAKVNLKQNPCADLKQALDLGFSQAQAAMVNYCR